MGRLVRQGLSRARRVTLCFSLPEVVLSGCDAFVSLHVHCVTYLVLISYTVKYLQKCVINSLS